MITFLFFMNLLKLSYFFIDNNKLNELISIIVN